MFEMGRIGRRLAQLRKAKDMTQMELADRLNISFQAVSNWERGQSMPDIAKLDEIASLLSVTIDELLGSERSAKLVKAVNSGAPVAGTLDKEELVAIAPLLKPTQFDRVVNEFRGIVDLSEIQGMLPFLSEDMLNEIAWDCYRANGITSGLEKLAPFLPDETLDKLVQQGIQDGLSFDDIPMLYPFLSEETLRQHAEAVITQTGNIGNIIKMAPFLAEEYINQLADDALETGGLNAITGLAPFMSDECLDALAIKTANEKGLNAIACIAPFVSDEILNRLAREALETHGIGALSPIMPFIDTGMIEDYLRRKKPYIKH